MQTETGKLLYNDKHDFRIVYKRQFAGRYQIRLMLQQKQLVD